MAHVSPVKSELSEHPKHQGMMIRSPHLYGSLSEFDYLSRYRRYLPETLALELENPLAEQFKAIEYLNRLLS